MARRWGIFNADCISKMQRFPANSIDSIVTDPPYGIAFMGKSWDAMGPTEFQAFSEAWGREALRILKPGGHVLAFAGSRTYHRMVCGLEDAGFEIRDCLMWLYGSGFPKNLDVSRAIDKSKGLQREVVALSSNGRPKKKNERLRGDRRIGGGDAFGEIAITVPVSPEAKRWQGYGTALKPSHEPIVLARKPLIGTVVQNVLAYGTGALNIDAGRIGTSKRVPGGRPSHNAGNQVYGKYAPKDGSESGYNPNIGRWPANVVHDGSEEVLHHFPHTASGQPGIKRGGNDGAAYGAESRAAGTQMGGFGDQGSAARFFYCAKTSRSEREAGLDGLEKVAGEWFQTANGTSGKPSSIAANRAERKPRANNHPTVKPVDLMRWLITLITPPGGWVLDPFAGSGSTGVAAVKHGYRFIGIEQDRNYARLAHRRIAHAESTLPPPPPRGLFDAPRDTRKPLRRRR